MTAVQYNAQLSLQNLTNSGVAYGFTGSHVVWDDMDSIGGLTYFHFDLLGISVINGPNFSS